MDSKIRSDLPNIGLLKRNKTNNGDENMVITMVKEVYDMTSPGFYVRGWNACPPPCAYVIG